DAGKAARHAEAGIRLAALTVRWERLEPEEGKVDARYVSDLKEKIAAFEKSGLGLILDLGVHYPPAWIFGLTNSRFVNQYGDAFVNSNAGLNVMNGVFNQAIRDKQAAYVAKVFAALGTNFFAVRIGWGHYAELHYPAKDFNGRGNAYWAYDDLAQGKTTGLPQGITVCPVPGWKPGTPSPNHQDASRFIEWYLDSLAGYQDFQIAEVRKSYPGNILALYADWGVRPGQIAEAVNGDLNGKSFAEKFDQLQKGYDHARFIRRVHDEKVLVYCTCVNKVAVWPETRSMVDDSDPDPRKWNPVHFLSSVAVSQKLKIFGENAGNNDLEGMRRSFERVKTYDLLGLMWAFEFQLYDKSGKYATLADYQNLIGAASGK
ncbi:MAG: hypothetical protein JNM63_17850, partial [Spirochaetia bacterium]|nr:hypothetical protein [Spirochaetia bacterium]